MAKITGISNIDTLANSTRITFCFDDSSVLEGTVIHYLEEKRCYVNIASSYNYAVFQKLGITDPKQFVSDVIGHKITNGDWPVVDTLQELKKVLIALLNYNNMEEKELKIEIPDGYVIDEENSTFSCIKFKPKQLTYKDIQKKLFLGKSAYGIRPKGIEQFACGSGFDFDDCDNIAYEKNAIKICAIIKLMNVAHYLNNGWTPSEDYKGYYIVLDGNNLHYNNGLCANYGLIRFKTKQLVEKAVEILGIETIKQALS